LTNSNTNPEVTPIPIHYPNTSPLELPSVLVDRLASLRNNHTLTQPPTIQKRKIYDIDDDIVITGEKPAVDPKAHHLLQQLTGKKKRLSDQFNYVPDPNFPLFNDNTIPHTQPTPLSPNTLDISGEN